MMYWIGSWLEEFGGLLGLRISDLTESYDIKINDLLIYTYPEKEIIEKQIYKGYFRVFFFMRCYENAKIAKKNGFKFYKNEVEGSSVNYENLDNFQTGIHDYFKYLKYSFVEQQTLCVIYTEKSYFKRRGNKKN